MTTPLFSDDFVAIHHGDCLDVMRGMDADSIDAIVTDPPYGLSFMGRDWDHGVPGEHFWREALRAAKPGAHLVAFGGTRTHHRLMCAIEDAGWEIRDCLGWLYGSGFPKSLDVSKAIDKAAGEAVEVGKAFNFKGGTDPKRADEFTENGRTHVEYAPISAAAAAWDGWGTALKPAWEPIILARKPLGSTVAACVQKHGTGALNIDGCRVEAEPWTRVGLRDDMRGGNWGSGSGKKIDLGIGESNPLGRWPANIVHDGSDEVLAVFPQTVSAQPRVTKRSPDGDSRNGYGSFAGQESVIIDYTDSGSAARFFYTAKANKSERDEGLYGDPSEYEHSGPRGHERNGDGSPRSRPRPRRNTHPTVKPLDLMRWLVRLVTPPDGVVLDPFMGSGTTLKAARAESHQSIGIDLEREHCEIAWGRLSQQPLF